MPQRRLLIVGGGSAGWITAAHLNGALNHRGAEKNVDIRLVESPDIPRISVGEATIPSIRHTLAVSGVGELEFMRAANVTFKQSIKYVNWVHNDNSFYHHPFSRFSVTPIDDLAQSWVHSDRAVPFMHSCSAQPAICELGLAPKTNGKWDIGAPLHYAYHMNAQKFADYLRDFSVARGVVHTLANVATVEMSGPQQIAAVVTDQGERIEADLFVDCTGFRAKLLEEQLGVPFEDWSQWLLCDRAITTRVPYDRHYPGMIRPYTTATALSNGWIWDIPMQDQRSIGYVHSSSFISPEDAERELRAYQGAGSEDLECRTIHFRVGRRKHIWHGNCVAIGLSGGFIEPLESTGLYLADLGAEMLADYFPYRDEHTGALSIKYNGIMENRYAEVLDFINLHYCLTQRTDTAFWREVQKPERVNDSLRTKLDLWKLKPPTSSDFLVDKAVLWNHQSYEFIMYGMNYVPYDVAGPTDDRRSPLVVHSSIVKRLKAAKEKLAPHVDWLKQNVSMQDYPTAERPAGWV